MAKVPFLMAIIALYVLLRLLSGLLAFLFIYLFIYIPIYCLLVLCPMSDITYANFHPCAHGLPTIIYASTWAFT